MFPLLLLTLNDNGVNLCTIVLSDETMTETSDDKSPAASKAIWTRLGVSRRMAIRLSATSSSRKPSAKKSMAVGIGKFSHQHSVIKFSSSSYRPFYCGLLTQDYSSSSVVEL